MQEASTRMEDNDAVDAVPEIFVCPITQEQMVDPEVALVQQLTQENARLTQQLQQLQQQERVQQLTLENARLTQQLQQQLQQERVQQLTQENARLTQQLQQQERQRFAPQNGDRGQWWNLSHRSVVSTVLVIVFAGIRLLLHCRHEEGDKSGAAIASAASSMALW